MIRVLFVDDEPEVLRGIRRTLRAARHECDANYFDRAEEALEYVRDNPVDVLVTDMQMPGMDGVSLLAEVKETRPEVVRIILSGNVETERILEASNYAHQILPKPCEPKKLHDTIRRAYHLSELLEEPGLKALVAKLNALPCRPAIYTEIVDETLSPECSIDSIGELAAKDLGIATKVLQLVNSDVFGLVRKVVDPIEAARLLGLDSIKALILSIEAFTPFQNDEVERTLWREVSEHSLRVATNAHRIAMDVIPDPIRADRAFMAGMLHDSGKLVLAALQPEGYDRALGLHRSESIPLYEAEMRVFGSTHGRVAACLLGMWGLPEDVAEAVAFHHTPGEYGRDEHTVMTAVHVANGIDEASELDHEYLARVGHEHRLVHWRALCSGASRRAAAG